MITEELSSSKLQKKLLEEELESNRSVLIFSTKFFRAISSSKEQKTIQEEKYLSDLKGKIERLEEHLRLLEKNYQEYTC